MPSSTRSIRCRSRIPCRRQGPPWDHIWRDPASNTPWEQLIAEQHALFRAHPRTTFIDAKPEVLDGLIQTLLHDRLAVRELAWLHLLLLVEDPKINYDPAADKTARDKAVDELKKLRTMGKLKPLQG